MIGGNDVVLDNPCDPEFALHEIASLISHVWPQLVVQDSDADVVLAPGPEGYSFAGLREIMIYKDEHARQSWANLGADPSNANTMIHILAGWNTLTLVVDDENDPEMKEILQLTRKFLKSQPARSR